MTFSLALPEDKAEILEHYHSLIGTEGCCWNEFYPAVENIDDDLSRDALFCLRDDDGRLLGTVSIDADPEVDALPCWDTVHVPFAELSRLGVARSAQGQGLAKHLMTCALEELRRRGYAAVHLLVAKGNARAIRAYAPFDFAVVGECQSYGGDYWCYEKLI